MLHGSVRLNSRGQKLFYKDTSELIIICREYLVQYLKGTVSILYFYYICCDSKKKSFYALFFKLGKN